MGSKAFYKVLSLSKVVNPRLQIFARAAISGGRRFHYRRAVLLREPSHANASRQRHRDGLCHARDEYIDTSSIVPRLYLMTRMLTELGKKK
jgi:acetylornithine deacetylase/succinyl-diaminopimelate desuccinylase-like protein